MSPIVLKILFSYNPKNKKRVSFSCPQFEYTLDQFINQNFFEDRFKIDVIEDGMLEVYMYYNHLYTFLHGLLYMNEVSPD